MNTPVRRALRGDSGLQEHVRDGVQAIERKHLTALIDDGIRSAFSDSLDLDKALEPEHPQDHRWDYLLGHDASGCVVGLEPHSAYQGHISRVNRQAGARVASARASPAGRSPGCGVVLGGLGAGRIPAARKGDAADSASGDHVRGAAIARQAPAERSGCHATCQGWQELGETGHSQASPIPTIDYQRASPLTSTGHCATDAPNSNTPAAPRIPADPPPAPRSSSPTSPPSTHRAAA